MGKTLFILEGRNAEPEILNTTLPLLLPDTDFTDNTRRVVYIFGTHIYSLYSRLKEDDGLGLIGMLKESDPDGVLADEDEESFEAVYMMFDYDGHVNMPRTQPYTGNHIDGDTAIEELLDFFDNETENGKLYLSYPMVEAIRHLSGKPSDPSDIITAKCKGPHCPNMVCPDRSTCPPIRKYYKSLVNELHPPWQIISEISPIEWKHIYFSQLATAFTITGETNRIPSQREIFDTQRLRYLSLPCPQVAVLSGFPLFYAEYLGLEAFTDKVGGLG